MNLQDRYKPEVLVLSLLLSTTVELELELGFTVKKDHVFIPPSEAMSDSHSNLQQTCTDHSLWWQ